MDRTASTHAVAETPERNSFFIAPPNLGFGQF
jgi:hypothetical protein